jgi:hypothetical protein
MVDGGPPIMKQHSHMYPPINRGVQKRISEEYKREYERLRGSIWRVPAPPCRFCGPCRLFAG